MSDAQLSVLTGDLPGTPTARLVTVSGELDLYTVPQLRDHLADVSDADPLDTVVDLRDVSFIDSAGMGLLVSAFKHARRRQRTLHLVISSPTVLRTFHSMGLQAALPLFSTLEQAATALATRLAKSPRAGGVSVRWSRRAVPKATNADATER